MSNSISKVLIAYSSTYGYVSEISDNIAKQLEEFGLQVDYLDINKTKSSRWPALNEYEGVIIGASKGSYTFWTKKAKKYITMNLALLKEKLFGCFISSPHSWASLMDPVQAKEHFGKKMLQSFDLIPDFYNDFGPVLDFSRKSKLDHETRNTLKSMVKAVTKKLGVELDYRGYNDFRDWVLIEEFAQEFAGKLNSKKCPNCANVVPANIEYCNHCGTKLE